MEHLFYDFQTKQFSLKETGSNEVVFDTHDRIGWTNGKDEFTCGIFRFEIRTNFYPTARHQEYIWINVFVHGVLLLPISLAAYNGRLDKKFISMAQYGKDNYRLFGGGFLSPHTVVMSNRDHSWSTNYDHVWIGALANVRDICNNYKDWMLREIRKLISSSATIGLENNPYHLRTLLELTENWSLVCPYVALHLQPLVGNYCFERMAALVQRIQTLDKTTDGQENVQTLVKNGDLYWNYIKGLCLAIDTKQEGS
ncbi:MAG: hypothetical protein IJK93_05180 [Muribaculaceae bacterium]|nr:hypothetical protein [Muribaculaceae bacterium]